MQRLYRVGPQTFSTPFSPPRQQARLSLQAAISSPFSWEASIVPWLATCPVAEQAATAARLGCRLTA